MSEYDNIHRRVRKARGKASTHPCVTGCGKPAWDWATITGTSGTELEHFQPMCRSCHVRYDREIRDTPAAREALEKFAAASKTPEALAKLSASLRGHPVSEETREKLRQANLGKALSPEHRAKIAEGSKRMHAEGRGRWAARTD